MKATPTDDVLFGKGTIDVSRPQASSDAYLFEVKTPAESKHPGRLLQSEGDDPGEKDARSVRLKDSGCPLVSG